MMATGKNGKQIKFQNTMLLPNCVRILISESKMDLAGCSINKPGGGIVRVRHVKSGELLMEGSLDSRSGLYSFKDLKFEKHTQVHLHATTKTNEQVQNAMQRAREGQLASRDSTTTAEAESQLQLHRIHAYASLDLLRQQYGIANMERSIATTALSHERNGARFRQNQASQRLSWYCNACTRTFALEGARGFAGN